MSAKSNLFATRRVRRSMALLCVSVVMLSGCSSVSVYDVINTAESVQKVAKATDDFTPEEEYYIGRSVAATIAGMYPVYDDARANKYVNVLGQILAQASDRPETFGGYHFQILDSEEINAFAAPGGFIFITRGLLRCAPTEDAVAAVLAHEIGHVQQQHGLKAIQKSRLTSALADAAVDTAQMQTGSATVFLTLTLFEGAIEDITTTLVNNGYSRAAEKEADEASAMILQRVGYNPYGLIEMLQLMAQRLDPTRKDFAKTHPSPASRIESVQSFMGTAVPGEPVAARQKRFEAALKNI